MRYRLFINICRGTNAGEALKLMASGSQVGHDLEDEAVELYERYLYSASFVLNAVDKGLFGMIALVDSQTGKIVLEEVLMGKVEKVS